MSFPNRAFYDLAKDPPASDPSSHSAELGYSIYGAGQGQVNLEERLASVATDVEANGATGSTFWRVNQPFALFRDGHVSLKDLAPGSLANGLWTTVYAERSLNGGTVTCRPEFKYDANGDFVFKIHWRNADGTTDESIVKSIDGKDTYSFFLDMANSEISNNWPTVGARMNHLLTFSTLLSVVGFFVPFSWSTGSPTAVYVPLF